MTSPDLLAAEPLAGFPHEIALALWTLQDTRSRTLKYVDGITDAVVDWTPPSQRNAIGTLLYHLATIEMDWLYTDILGTALPAEIEDLLPIDNWDPDGNYAPIIGESLDQHLARLTQARTHFLDAFEGMTVKDFRRPRKTLEDWHVTAEWVIHHLCQHEAEHRGQIWEVRVAAEADLAAD